MSVMISSRAANVFTKVLFAVSVFMSLEGTFVSLNFIQAAVNIPAAFCFYFLIRNPVLLVAKDFDEFGELFDDAVDKKFIWGTAPICPAMLLISISYIAFMKYGLPF